MLADDTGDVPWRGPHGYGLFDGDTRMLHGFVLELDGQAPTLLSVTDTRGFEARHDPAHSGTCSACARWWSLRSLRR